LTKQHVDTINVCMMYIKFTGVLICERIITTEMLIVVLNTCCNKSKKTVFIHFIYFLLF